MPTLPSEESRLNALRFWDREQMLHKTGYGFNVSHEIEVYTNHNGELWVSGTWDYNGFRVWGNFPANEVLIVRDINKNLEGQTWRARQSLALIP